MINTNTPRNINAELKGFVNAVNHLMVARFGISFTAINDDVGGYDRARAAVAAGQSVEGFVSSVERDASLKPAAPGFSALEAREYNKYQAALVNYAAETPGWSVGTDGIYAQSPAGVVQFKPELKSGRWRFALSAAENSSLAGDPSVKPKAESFGLEFVTSHADLNEAWDHFVELKPEFAEIGVERDQVNSFTI